MLKIPFDHPKTDGPGTVTFILLSQLRRIAHAVAESLTHNHFSVELMSNFEGAPTDVDFFETYLVLLIRHFQRSTAFFDDPYDMS